MSRKDISDHDVVRAAREFHRDAMAVAPLEFGTEILARLTGQPLKVCERAYERAAGRGLIECGVSLRTAWPTPKGLALLESEVTP